MKKMLFILLLLCCHAFATTLDEDYEQMRPLMDMLSTGGGGTVNLLKPYAEKGNAVAAHLLGVIYEEGRITDQDKKKAFEFYSLGAQKNPESAIRKADMLVTGEGTDINLDEAKAIYQNLFDNKKFGEYAKNRFNQIELIENSALYLKQMEEDALNNSLEAQLFLAEYMLESVNFVGAYIWFSILSENDELSDKKEEYKAFLDKLQGEMTLSEIVQAEKELQDIKEIISKTVLKPGEK